MKAGQTDIEVGTKIRITHIANDASDDAMDKEMNRTLEGKTGKATHPFAGYMWPGVKYTIGVWLDDLNTGWGDSLNLTTRDKFEVMVEEAQNG